MATSTPRSEAKNLLNLQEMRGYVFLSPQEQNGISEANWRNVRNLAFACLNNAKMNMNYFHCALEQAWKIHSVLPHKALTKTDGTVQCPLSVYTSNERVEPIETTQTRPEPPHSTARIIHNEECAASMSAYLATLLVILSRYHPQAKSTILLTFTSMKNLIQHSPTRTTNFQATSM
jgi:hypothetical protein